MVSKTGMLSLVKGFRWNDVETGLKENRDLLAFRDERGRNWLHVCCAAKATGSKVQDSIRTAGVLLAHGLDIDREAFTEGTWKATPLWYAIGRGRNLALAEYLLKRGCNPNNCLFAAAFNNDIPAIRLLARYGANVNEAALDETPFLIAIKTSHFGPAKVLLDLGADPNYRDRRGMTALHYMLKKSSDKTHFAMLLAHGARGDIANAQGVTAVDLLSRRKDPAFRRMAEKLAIGQVPQRTRRQQPAAGHRQRVGRSPLTSV
jgi:hypothetical protein